MKTTKILMIFVISVIIFVTIGIKIGKKYDTPFTATDYGGIGKIYGGLGGLLASIITTVSAALIFK